MPFAPPPDPNTPLSWAKKRGPAPAPYYAGGEEPTRPTAFGPVAKFFGALGGAAAVGFMPTQGGTGRIWDKYLHYIRRAEDVSPGRMFRTFGYSEFLSPLGTQRGFDLSRDLFFRTVRSADGPVQIANRPVREMVARMVGRDIGSLEAGGIFDKGLRFDRTGSVFGKLSVRGTGEILSEAVMPLQITQHRGGSTFADWWARASGVKVGYSEGLASLREPTMMTVGVPKVDKVLGIPLSESAAAIYQKMRAGTTHMRAYWAGQMGRLNRLLQSPGDFVPALERGLTKAGIKLPVQPGTATQMLGRYAAKALWIGGAASAISYLSYRRKETDSKILTGTWGAALGGAFGAIWASRIGKNVTKGAAIGGSIGAALGLAPIFDQGITEGSATLWTRGQMGLARGGDVLGIDDSIARQEALMPGITSPLTAIGFGAGGALTGGFAGYGTKLKIGSEAAAEAGQALKQAVFAVRNKGFLARAGAEHLALGADISATQRLALRGGRIGAATGLAAFSAFAAGAAIGTGQAIPGLVGRGLVSGAAGAGVGWMFKRPGVGGIIGAAVGMMFGPDESVEDLEAIYSGQKDIAVRGGRWWEFGRSSYEGGRIQYYKPHWYPTMLSGARDIGLYGSEKAKWDRGPVDMDYEWEKQNYYDRPYPMTGSPFNDVPFVGPLLEGMGRLIKPTQIMHPSEWMRGGGEEVLHVPTAAGGEPAIELGGLGPGVPTAPGTTRQRLGEAVYRLNELRGLTGFMHGSIKEALTGSQDYFDQQTRIETSDRAYGAERWYWDKELGGIAGLSEAIRRAIPHRRRQIDLYNPIENMMPDWLPGPEYYVDFQHGDPYTKVKEGEIRLPGAGYAALNPEVRGLAPEEYPLFHRFKVLADVAPYSPQFKQARFEMDAAANYEELSPREELGYREITRQVSEKQRRKEFTPYRFAGDLVSKQVSVKQHVSPGLFESESGEVFRLSGIKTYDEGISDRNRQILEAGGGRTKQTQISDYLREYIYPGAELDVYVHRDPTLRFQQGGIQPAAIMAGGEHLGAGLVEAGLGEYKESPFAVAGQYNAAQQALGSWWERSAHDEGPIDYLTPLSPTSKFIHQRSPIEEYERTRVWGKEAAFWQHPYEHFLKPAYEILGREYAGKESIPQDVQRRWEIEEYFDKLKWLKMRTLRKAAQERGEGALGQDLKKQMRQTMFGVDPFGPRGNIFAALPSLERDYFDSFSQADEGQKEVIRGMVPGEELKIYESQWLARTATGIRGMMASGEAPEGSADFLQDYESLRMSEGFAVNEQLMQQYQASREEGESYSDWSRRKLLDEYFKEAPLPGADWVGWHPHVDLDDIKLTVINNVGLDMHDFNLWQSRERTLLRKPYIGSEAEMEARFSGDHDVASTTRDVETALRGLSMDGVQVSVLPGPPGADSFQLDVQDSRRTALDRYKQEQHSMGMM